MLHLDSSPIVTFVKFRFVCYRCIHVHIIISDILLHACTLIEYLYYCYLLILLEDFRITETSAVANHQPLFCFPFY